MPELSPDLKLEDINYIQDKIIESKEDSSFDIISELRRKSDSLGTTTDSVKFSTFCSLLADLIEVDWSVDVSRKGFVANPPEFGSNSEDKIKARKSNLNAAHTDIDNPIDAKFIRKLRYPPIGSKIKSIDTLVDDGNELKKIFQNLNKIKDESHKLEELNKVIKPEIQHCFLEERCSITNLRLLDIWRYFRLTWSMPYQTANARTMPFLIRNGARLNKPVIGIFQLVNPFFNNIGRNNFLRWDNYISLIEEIRDKNIKINEVSEALLNSIDKTIKETRYDDFNLSKSDISKPSEKIIDKFRKLSEQYRDEEHLDEKKDLKTKIKIKTRREAETPRSKSEEPMYKKKRAKRLSKLLFARKIFNDYKLKTNTKKAITVLIQTDEGRRAIHIGLEYMRQNIYSTQAADLNVCGAVAPYNELIGGKLITLLSTSKDVLEKYEKNYKKEVSIISSAVAGRNLIKPAKIIFLTVSSLYGSLSSQYNRLKLLKKDFPKLKTNLVWNEAGTTEGIGSYHISQKTSNLMDRLTQKAKKFKKKSISGKGHSHKIRKIIIGLKILNLPPEKILMHSQKRKNYVFFHKDKKEIIKYLYGLKKLSNFSHCSSINEITKAWSKRWLLNRISRTETLQNLENLNSKSISKIFEKILINNPDKEKNLSLFSKIS